MVSSFEETKYEMMGRHEVVCLEPGKEGFKD